MNHAITVTTTALLATPPVTAALDAEVDLEVLKHIPKQFEIVDEKSANWLVKKIAAARQYGKRVKEWAEQEQRRAEREEQTLMFLFGRQIEGWAKSEVEKLSGRRKSFALPAGTVGFRTSNAKLVIDDEKSVLAWAKENCQQVVVIVERVSKSSLDEYVESTGHYPEIGAHIEPAAERFFVK